MVVYFSGSGNSKYVAKRIADSLQEKLLCMNERIKSSDTGPVKTGEKLVVVVPTYAWRIPRVVSNWIGQTEFVGAKNVWYLMSCGSGIGNADIYNRKLSEKKGLKHMGTVFYPVFVKAKAFYADQTCTGCGKCVKVCPLNNVTMNNKKPVWGKHCTHCMACICHCPAEAIEYGRKSVGKPRYCFENLGIEETGTLLRNQ